MPRYNARTVELNDYECDAHEQFDALLDEGHTIEDAIASLRRIFPGLHTPFIQYLRGVA